MPGLSLYGMFSAVSLNMIGSGLAALFWIDTSHYCHTEGFRIMYGRSSNIKSFKLVVKLGAHMTTKMKVV